MKRAEAEKLLEIASTELATIPKGHRDYVIGLYAEQWGLEDAQLKLGVEGAEEEGPTQLHAATLPGDQQAPKARAGDPAASHRAALDNAPRRESQRHRIIELMATISVGKAWLAEEIADQTGIPLNSVSTRMSELVTGGWVNDAGPKRQTRHGEAATTYVPSSKTLDHFRAEADAALAAA